MKEKNNTLGNITVKSLLLEDEDYYKEQYIDCIDIDTITISLLARPSATQHITECIERYCDSSTYSAPVINGRIREYISHEETCPLSSVVLKQLYSTTDKKTYNVKLTLTLRIHPLIIKHEQDNTYYNVKVDDDGIYNTSRVVYKELRHMFCNSGTALDVIFSSYTIDSVRLIGSILTKHLPDKNCEKYMKLLSCARRYRHMTEYAYNSNSKSLNLVGKSFKLSFRDGNTVLSKMDNKSSYESKDTHKASYCKDSIQVTFDVTKDFFNIEYLRDTGKIDTSSKYIQKFNINIFTDVLRRTYDVFINIMIFMYTSCDFYNASIARRKIRESSFHSDTKDTLRAYATRCANNDKFVENSKLFKQFFKVEYSNAYSNTRKKFEKMDMSTIIIPDILGVSEYKNPLVYMYLSKHPGNK